MSPDNRQAGGIAGSEKGGGGGSGGVGVGWGGVHI